MDIVGGPVNDSPGSQNHRYLLLSIIGIVLIAVIVTGISVVHHKNRANSKSTITSAAAKECSSDGSDHLIVNTISDVETNNFSQADESVSKIEGLNGFTQQPNCLYVLMAYYVNVNDGPDAQKYLKDFDALPNAQKALSSSLYNYRSISTLRSEIAFQIGLENQENQNSKTIGQVPAGPSQP